MRNNVHTDQIIKQAFTASAIATGAAGAVTGVGAMVFDLRNASTETADLKNPAMGNGVLYGDVVEVVFLCSANAGTSVTFTVQESDTGTLTSNRLTSGTNITGATVTILAADERKVASIRLRLDRGTVTKRYIAVNCEGSGSTVEAVAIACFLLGSAMELPVVQDLATVSVE